MNECISTSCVPPNLGAFLRRRSQNLEKQFSLLKKMRHEMRSRRKMKIKTHRVPGYNHSSIHISWKCIHRNSIEHINDGSIMQTKRILLSSSFSPCFCLDAKCFVCVVFVQVHPYSVYCSAVVIPLVKIVICSMLDHLCSFCHLKILLLMAGNLNDRNMC